MKKRLIFVLAMCFGCGYAMVLAQTESQLKRAAKGKAGVTQEELVSFRADVPYSQAIQSLSELSKKLTGKIIVDQSPLKGKDKQLGVNIESMYWRDALELILRSNQIWYNEFPEYFEVVALEDVGKKAAAEKAPTETTTTEKGKAGQPTTGAAAQQAPVVVDSGEVYAKTREVTISSIFFEVDQTKLAQSGLSFSFFRGRDLNLGVEIVGTRNIATSSLSVDVSPTSNRLAVDINAALRMFESQQLGEVIARPQVTVRSGASALMQIGQDFSVKEKDFSGNITDRFYKTGTILQVRPKVYKFGDLEFIDLTLSVERSTPLPGQLSTIVNKTAANSSLSLFNGEESYVGGLYSNDETTVREGVPVLKDLPWWVFGLRYLFGYDSKTINRKELIVLIKADLVPFIEDRVAQKAAQKNVIQEKQKEIQQDMERRTKKKPQ